MIAHTSSTRAPAIDPIRWTITCQSCSGSGIDFKVALSTGDGFTAPESWLADSGAYSSGQAKYADVNGDGRADLIFQTSANEMKVSLSTGFGFAAVGRVGDARRDL